MIRVERLERIKSVKDHAWTPTRIALLMYPMVFLSVHGSFSFLGAGAQAEASSLSAAAPQGGVLRNGLLPGVAYSIICWLIIRNGRVILEEARKRVLFSVIALLAVASIVWSQVPLRTTMFSGIFLVDTLFAYYLITAFTHEQVRKLVMYSGFIIVISSILVAILTPKYGTALYSLRDRGTWNGIFTDRTSCAKCVIFLLTAAVSFSRQNRWVLGTYVFLMFVLLGASRSATSVIVLVGWASAITLLTVYIRLNSRARLFLLFNVLLVVCVGTFFVSYILPLILEALGRDATFSGRTLVWSAVFSSILKRPWLGYGFYGFWLGMKGESFVIITQLHWLFGYAHNGILEIAVQLGVVGVVLFLATLVQGFYHAWICYHNGRFKEVQWYISILILTVLYNIDEVTVLWPNDLLSILYIVACCGLAHAAQQSRTTERAPSYRRPSVVAQLAEHLTASKAK